VNIRNTAPSGGNPPVAPADKSKTAFADQQNTANSNPDTTNVPSGLETSTATYKEPAHKTIANAVPN
jgi:hypothetical protein